MECVQIPSYSIPPHIARIKNSINTIPINVELKSKFHRSESYLYSDFYDFKDDENKNNNKKKIL